MSDMTHFSPIKSQSRRTSVIIPQSGDRLHGLERAYTLSSDQASENTPLLDSSYSPPQNSFLPEKLRTFLASENAHRIIKCSIAYFLGSLATYVTPISTILGRYDGKHMVATCCVYFHPARTAGSMYQASIYASAAFLYSTVVGMASMAITVVFARVGWIEFGHFLVLLLFCAGGLGYIGYVKQKMAHPTVGVACSLASISLITMLTKEGSIQTAQFRVGKIVQVSIIVVMAIVISNVLAFVLWPSSAITELRKRVETSLYSFSDSLSAITHSFLEASDEDIKPGKFGPWAENHRTVFTTLSKHLVEAKYEHYIRGTEKEYIQEKLLIESMQRLSQNIGGLRSAALTQSQLVQQVEDGPKGTSIPSLGAQPIQARRFAHHDVLMTPPDHSSHLSSSANRTIFSPTLGATPEEGPYFSDGVNEAGTDSVTDNANALTMYRQFIQHLGPPMKSLAYTLTELLDDLPYGDLAEREGQQKINVNPKFHKALVDALDLFAEKRKEALTALYQSETITKSRTMDANTDVEEIAASCHYFSYNLENFAQEMKTYLQILEELQYLEEHRTRSWEWLKFWKKKSRSKKVDRGNDTESGASTPTQGPPPKPIRAATIPNLSPTATVPFTYKLWRALSFFRRDPIKFSIKVGLGAALYCLPAYIPATRPIFAHWRGEWGLVSYMIIMSMTLGQTNNSGAYRVLGTIIGAGLALFAWVAWPENPYALAAFGWIVSMPCFQIILNWKQATFGRFILLTYNLSALYAYSLSMKDDDDGEDDDEGGVSPIITEIVLHRTISVIVGVLWGLFVNRAIWPLSARSQLRKGLSKLWLKMSIVWAKDPLNVLVDGHSSRHPGASLSQTTTLQKNLVSLSTLLSSAPHEFRLKGPFPTHEYTRLLNSTQRILDALHGLHVIITKDPHPNPREADILAKTQREREDLSARISHVFYVLGSSLRIGFPLPEHLPNAGRSRERLLARVGEVRGRVKGRMGEEGEGEREMGQGDVEEKEEDFAMVYGYVLVTARVQEGLEELERTLGELYGVLEDASGVEI